VEPLERAWSMVSAAPARAAGLHDRGRIERGMRADLVLVDPQMAGRPRVVAVLVGGRIVHLCETGRMGA
jgi:alpha-D-ribose 1-methylphosphonate 5-triphosphate diphosphatase